MTLRTDVSVRGAALSLVRGASSPSSPSRHQIDLEVRLAELNFDRACDLVVSVRTPTMRRLGRLDVALAVRRLDVAVARLMRERAREEDRRWLRAVGDCP